MNLYCQTCNKQRHVTQIDIRPWHDVALNSHTHIIDYHFDCGHSYIESGNTIMADIDCPHCATDTPSVMSIETKTDHQEARIECKKCHNIKTVEYPSDEVIELVMTPDLSAQVSSLQQNLSNWVSASPTSASYTTNVSTCSPSDTFETAIRQLSDRLIRLEKAFKAKTLVLESFKDKLLDLTSLIDNIIDIEGDEDEN